MRVILFAILALFLASPLSAADQSPAVKALSSRVLAEVNSNLECSAANIELHDKLVASDAEIKRLKDKYEPKKEDDKK